MANSTQAARPIMVIAFSTKLGHMALAIADGKLQALTFGHPTQTAARTAIAQLQPKPDRGTPVESDDDAANRRLADALRDRLQRFASGERVDFADVPLDLAELTEFQRHVVAACRAIPWGKTRSYGELAARVKHPGAARAVGTVMSSNRLPLVVPCHRVLGAGGKLGGYTAPQGLEMKRRLLAAEGREA
jgi:methylated-DNA-[protein]-cysteine S-methyltransferase